VFIEQMRDEFTLEKISRIAHRPIMMAIKTKNVQQKPDSELCPRNSQPSIVILSALLRHSKRLLLPQEQRRYWGPIAHHSLLVTP
jgi:hypothetical protein